MPFKMLIRKGEIQIMNKVIVIGYMTADPKLRQTQSGVATCRFMVAVNRNFKNANGEYEADFPTCVAWRQTAQFISKYFKKGQMIALEGTLRTGSYQDRNHSDVTHYTTEIYVDSAEFCGSKGSGSNNTAAPAPTAQSVVQQAQNANIQTAPDYGNLSDFEEILSDGDAPF